MSSATLFLFSASFVLGADSKFALIIGIASLVSTLFFIFSLIRIKSSDIIRACASIFIAATPTMILASVYFDMTIAMNSPHKILGAFALMSAMVFSLCETRLYLKKAVPRLHLASALLTFMFGISFALSAIIYIFASQPSKFVSNSIILGNIAYIGIIIGISVYAITRAFMLQYTQSEKN